MKITIYPDSRAYCWIAVFNGLDTEIDGQPLPLPLTTDATPADATRHVKNLFPSAEVTASEMV